MQTYSVPAGHAFAGLNSSMPDDLVHSPDVATSPQPAIARVPLSAVPELVRPEIEIFVFTPALSTMLGFMVTEIVLVVEAPVLLCPMRRVSQPAAQTVRTIFLMSDDISASLLTIRLFDEARLSVTSSVAARASVGLVSVVLNT